MQSAARCVEQRDSYPLAVHFLHRHLFHFETHFCKFTRRPFYQNSEDAYVE